MWKISYTGGTRICPANHMDCTCFMDFTGRNISVANSLVRAAFLKNTAGLTEMPKLLIYLNGGIYRILMHKYLSLLYTFPLDSQRICTNSVFWYDIQYSPMLCIQQWWQAINCKRTKNVYKICVFTHFHI